jgi:putative heme-binding domain-containing protein
MRTILPIAAIMTIAAFQTWTSADLARGAEPNTDGAVQEKPAPAGPPRAAGNAARKSRPSGVGPAVGENRATPVERLKVAKGFRVELIYSVPGAEQGSWVNLCVDPQDRILASDQYGGLYRFTPSAPGRPLDPAAVEKVPAPIRAVNGMAFAFGSLYAAVNDYANEMQNGLYRVTDSDGDDRLDKVELLRPFESKNDHGIHALLPSPDGRSLFFVTGNGTKPTDFSSSRVSPHWGEDHLLPRMPDGRGFMRDVLAPGGIIYRVSPDGKEFEVYSSGYRNIFDAAFNRDGELFTFDADMEYDFNTPWYRPTRICHVVSGSEFGWRNGAGKWPEWYPDNLPPVVNVGPGSPTGMMFGYGAKFPVKYQRALYGLDWSWGKLYAFHLKPNGASYAAEKEEFLSGTPLPLTDAVIHPRDGAMYFAIGGRQVQSGLYRVTYVGEESTAPAEHVPVDTPERTLRHRLEAFHGRQDPKAIEAAWPYLGHSDRFVRWAARTAIEHQPAGNWSEKALAETDSARRVEALLALARVTGFDPFHRRPSDPPPDEAMRTRLLDAIERIDWGDLDERQRITLVRALEIVLNRFGLPHDATVARLLAKFDPLFPAGSQELNRVLCESLVFLQSREVAAEAVALMESAATQEEQMEYARSLRMLKAGWTPATRTAYFRWFLKAASYRGGASFERFLEFIRTDAVASLSDEERDSMRDLLAEKPVSRSPLEGLAVALAGRPRTEWTLDELSAAAGTGLHGRNFENGRRMFAAAACFACHRFGNEGGMTGPDLTSAGRRYSPRDLFDQIVNPSKEINEQFVPMVILTDDGLTHTGVVVNLNGDRITVNTDPADPYKRVDIGRKTIELMEPSKVSPMPAGLLAPLTKDEILDLVAYVLSGGDAQHEAFGQRPASATGENVDGPGSRDSR